MKKYYDFLKEELNMFGGNFPKFILHLPSLFKLLCDLLEEDLDKETKRKINSALAYFVLPNDIISEELYGPAGYVDDTYVCSFVLKDIYEKYGVGMLKKKWQEEEDVVEVIEDCYQMSNNELNKEEGLTERVLKAASLD